MEAGEPWSVLAPELQGRTHPSSRPSRSAIVVWPSPVPPLPSGRGAALLISLPFPFCSSCGVSVDGAGFHHHTDEEELQDPLTAASHYALQTSALWDVLFDATPSADDEKRPVVVREATYGLRTEDGESAVGLGIKWARKAAVAGAKDEGGWAWIWGELDGWDDDDDEGDDDGADAEAKEPKAVQKRFKGVHLAKLVEDADDDDEAEAVGAREPAEDAVGQSGDA